MPIVSAPTFPFLRLLLLSGFALFQGILSTQKNPSQLLWAPEEDCWVLARAHLGPNQYVKQESGPASNTHGGEIPLGCILQRYLMPLRKGRRGGAGGAAQSCGED